MYVCICNAVTDVAVHDCLAGGARNTREVREGCGMQPGCGSCTKRLRSMVSDWLTAAEMIDAITGGPATLTAVPEQPAEITVAREVTEAA